VVGGLHAVPPDLAARFVSFFATGLMVVAFAVLLSIPLATTS